MYIRNHITDQTQIELACSVLNHLGRGGPTASPETLQFFAIQELIRVLKLARPKLAAKAVKIADAMLPTLTAIRREQLRAARAERAAEEALCIAY